MSPGWKLTEYTNVRFRLHLDLAVGIFSDTELPERYGWGGPRDEDHRDEGHPRDGGNCRTLGPIVTPWLSDFSQPAKSIYWV